MHIGITSYNNIHQKCKFYSKLGIELGTKYFTVKLSLSLVKPNLTHVNITYPSVLPGSKLRQFALIVWFACINIMSSGEKKLPPWPRQKKFFWGVGQKWKWSGHSEIQNKHIHFFAVGGLASRPWNLENFHQKLENYV